ncbi:MAG TPA: ABC transporter permease, partial [Synergistales bacterium]|nr:ABC transporter permease [Synergistales bacterium]
FWRGLVLLAADGLAIALPELRGETLHFLLAGRIGAWGVPAQALWAVALALLLAFLLNRRPFGDAILFIGDNRNTAEMMGIPVGRVRIAVFALMGLLAAFAGILATFELNNWWPTQGEGYMLMVFASVFVGGTSAYGGEGTIYGSFIGAIIIGIIEAGIVSAGLVGFWTRLVHGLVILLSVSVYALLARRRAR